MTIKLTEAQRKELKKNILSSFIELIEGRPGLKEQPEISKAYRDLKEYLRKDQSLTNSCNSLKHELKEITKSGEEGHGQNGQNKQ